MSTSLQVAFLTGQSHPASCALSPAQEAFLDRLALPDVAVVRRNFPYGDVTPPYRDVALLAASWNNTRQYWRSRTIDFANRHRPDVVRLIDRADCTVLLAGSCGLELLTNLDLRAEDLARLRVFAYGAVARRRPACDVFAVLGRRDWIARAFGGPIDAAVDCGHMDYLETPDVLTLCRSFIANVAGRSRVSA